MKKIFSILDVQVLKKNMVMEPNKDRKVYHKQPLLVMLQLFMLHITSSFRELEVERLNCDIGGTGSNKASINSFFSL